MNKQKIDNLKKAADWVMEQHTLEILKMENIMVRAN